MLSHHYAVIARLDRAIQLPPGCRPNLTKAQWLLDRPVVKLGDHSYEIVAPYNTGFHGIGISR